jgi:hypothetical protein
MQKVYDCSRGLVFVKKRAKYSKKSCVRADALSIKRPKDVKQTANV